MSLEVKSKSDSTTSNGSNIIIRPFRHSDKLQRNRRWRSNCCSRKSSYSLIPACDGVSRFPESGSSFVFMAEEEGLTKVHGEVLLPGFVEGSPGQTSEVHAF